MSELHALAERSESALLTAISERNALELRAVTAESKVVQLERQLAEAKAAVPVVQPGYALVPLEPTPGMIKAGGKAAREYYELFGGNSPSIIYEAMINAAPQAAEQTKQQEPK